MAINSGLRTKLANLLRGSIFQTQEVDGIPDFFDEAAWNPLHAFGERIAKDSSWVSAIEVVAEAIRQSERTATAWKNEGLPIYLDGRVCAEFSDEVVEAVLSHLESLPHRCVFRFPFPGIAPHIKEEIALGKDCRLLLNPVSNKKPREQRGLSIASLDQQPSDSEAEAILEVTVEGHFGRNWKSSAQRRAYSRLKQFFAVGIATGNLILLEAWRDIPADRGDAKLVAGRNESNGAETTFPLSAEVATLIRRVETKKVLPPRQGASLLTSESGSLVVLFALVEELFSHELDAYEVTHVSAAIEWQFEAHLQSNQTFKFILTCIALESLLGSSRQEEYGVTAQLADRCAFLLGRGRTDREAKREAFVQLYKARSKLVHGTSVQLAQDDLKHLEFANESLQALIVGELNQLRRSRS